MKALIKLCLILFLFVQVACKPSPQKAEGYYLDISKPIESILIKEEDLINNINLLMNKDSSQASNSIMKKQTKNEDIESYKALDMAFSNFQLQIASSLNQMESIGAFDNKTTLKDAATDLLTEYKNVSEKEYPLIMTKIKIPDTEYTIEDDSVFMSLTDSIDNKLHRKISDYIRTVKLFAHEYNFKLEKDTLQ